MKAKITQLNQMMVAVLTKTRKDKNLTMRVLAEKIDVPHSFIGKIEKQSKPRRMDVGEFVYYCEAMEANPVDMLAQIIKQNKE
ncbi:MAG: transcriptional regulator with XRE-family HTH domain [Alteromonadaceae bacterium]|jgi:transcriptional regulator with XRE-family HTH domain